MAGTPDVSTDFDTKTELDFRNRLIAKFAIPRARSFWSTGFEAAPKTALYPSNDRVKVLCEDVVSQIQRERAAVSDMGELLVEWAKLEERILPRARQLTERNVSVREAIHALVSRGQIDKDVAAGLDEVRRVRNAAAHTPGRLAKAEVDQALHRLRKLSKRIPSY
jgi:uncharacterized protein YutE (UPF0331/DUF86 family)